MLPLRQQNFDREELFISRYSGLRDQALKLTDRNAEEAEDLLHDAFIHFTLSQTPVEEIQNLDGYLYTMLRNLRLSQARRLARTPQGHLSLIDYDSAEAGLNSTDPRDKIKAQDELRAIAQYACVRKDTSKAGGVLILRFFHGYFPNEIAQILRSPRSAVDNLLQTARREARLYKADPEALTFLHADKAKTLPEFVFGHLSTDILTEVRGSIFEKPDTDCPDAKIKDIYDANESEEKPVTAGFLSHIATCRTCLDEVNEALGLPTLASRLTADEPKPTDKKPRSGGGSSGGGMTSTDAFLKRSRKRLKQIFEHRPEALLISVNGFVIGSQRINSEKSELALSVKLDEKIGFVEIFSERDVRLLFQTVEPPPDGLAIQPARVELSDGRQLELFLDFTDNWPQLYASYRDPGFLSKPEAVSAGILTAEKLVRREPSEPTELESADGDRDGSLFPTLEEAQGVSLRRSWFTPFRLAFGAVLLFIALFGAWLSNQPDMEKPLVARVILKQAREAEFALAPTAEKVLHRNYQIEEWANGNLSSRKRVDEWRQTKVAARRTYDESGQMVAGTWTNEDGSQQVFNQGERLRSVYKSDVVDEPTIEPTANSFANLVDRHGVASRVTVAELPGQYFFNFEDRKGETEQTGINDRLIAASLTIDRDTYNPISQTLVLQVGGELREYRFTDVRVEQKPLSEVSPLIFLPEAELTKGATTVTKPLEIDLPSVPPAVAGGDLKTNPNGTTASLDTEVEVMRALDSINALSGDQITVTRTTTGQLKVSGIVDSPQRKTEILNALSALKNAPGVTIDILTGAEAAKKQTQAITGDNITIESVTAEVTTQLPVEPELNAYFAKRGISGEALNNEVRQYASAVLNRSRALRRNALALKSLAERFSPAELDRLEPARRDQWKALLRSKAAAVAGDVRSLNAQLSAVGLNGGGGDGAGGAAVRDASDVAEAAQRLFGLAAACDVQVSQSFTISGRGAASVKTVQFWRNLRQMASIAAEIQRF